MKLIEFFTKMDARSEGNGSAATKRDGLLDFLKGVAIVLVVLGHYLQSTSENFDDLYAFRVIYSFHMPFFVFLSGAAAARWVARFDSIGDFHGLLRISVERVRSSANRLLVPFAAWTLVRYALLHRGEGFGQYAQGAFEHVDRSLWFLPCIFWLTVYTVSALLMLHALRLYLVKLNLPWAAGVLNSVSLQAACMFVMWLAARKHMPAQFGLDFANEIGRSLYLFFLLGVVLYGRIKFLRNEMLRLGPCLAFLILAPFWHRTMSDNIAPDAPAFLLSSHWFHQHFTLMMALSGTFFMIEMSRRLVSIGVKSLESLFCSLGTKSLAIYATHYYFLSCSPPVGSAIFIGVLLYKVMNLFPLSRKLFLGE